MKNKDGIVIKIKPEQVWSLVDREEKLEIVAKRGPEWVCVIGDGNSEHLTFLEGLIFDELLISHDGADLEAARSDGWEVWVEGMDMPDLDAITCVEVLGEPDLWYGSSRVAACPEYTYRYKLKEETPYGYQACLGVPDNQESIMPMSKEDYESHYSDRIPEGIAYFRDIEDAKAWIELKEPVAADESCHVLTQLIIDVMPYEILENAYWEFDAMRKVNNETERDAFKRVARMTISATVNHLLSSLK